MSICHTQLLPLHMHASPKLLAFCELTREVSLHALQSLGAGNKNDALLHDEFLMGRLYILTIRAIIQR
jgi:hypothetical protein